MKTSKAYMIYIYTVLIIMLIITIFPLIYTVASSFKTNSEIMAHPDRIFPREFTFDNYIAAYNSGDFNILRMLWNSTLYTLICVAITLITSSMGGYVFARGEFPGKKLVFAVFSSLMFIALGSITVYPMFEILNFIGVSRSLWGLILVKIFGISIINIYLVRSYVRTLPASMDEAAQLDGCSFIGIFFKIIAPLLKPILATIGILAFQQSWNDYLLPTIFTLTTPSQRTLIVGVVALKTSGEAASSWNLMLAGTTVALVPVLVAYTIGNKYFISGLMGGAIKG